MREFLYDLMALLWPASCVGCSAPDRELCTECARRLRELPCATPPGSVWADVRVSEHLGTAASSLEGPLLIAAGPYDGVVRDLLIAYKHGGSYGFVRPLGRRLGEVLFQAATALAATVPAATGGPERRELFVVPVPSRASRVRERGYRHMEALVRVGLRGPAWRRLRTQPRLLRALRPTRGRTGQVGLSVEARERNARRLTVPPAAARVLRGRDVILVDDIVTSGATTRAAQDALESAGARVHAIVVLCAVAHKNARGETQVESNG